MDNWENREDIQDTCSFHGENYRSDWIAEGLIECFVCVGEKKERGAGK